MTADELLTLRDKLVNALGTGTSRVATPQLGEVDYCSPAQLQSAISWIDGELQMTSPTTRTFVFQSNRGTGGWQ